MRRLFIHNSRSFTACVSALAAANSFISPTYTQSNVSSSNSHNNGNSPIIDENYAPGEGKGKPILRLADVEKHITKENGIWVIYKDGVYDITKFVNNHPGGSDKIVLAAGKSVEPFWRIYR